MGCLQHKQQGFGSLFFEFEYPDLTITARRHGCVGSRRPVVQWSSVSGSPGLTPLGIGDGQILAQFPGCPHLAEASPSHRDARPCRWLDGVVRLLHSFRASSGRAGPHRRYGSKSHPCGVGGTLSATCPVLLVAAGSSGYRSRNTASASAFLHLCIAPCHPHPCTTQPPWNNLPASSTANPCCANKPGRQSTNSRQCYPRPLRVAQYPLSPSVDGVLRVQESVKAEEDLGHRVSDHGFLFDVLVASALHIPSYTPVYVSWIDSSISFVFPAPN